VSPNVAPHWSASTPTVAGAQITALAGVTCLSASNCWAVGTRDKTLSSSTGPALIEHYSGGKWTAVAAAAAPAGTAEQLSGVSCLSATNCWAVGQRSSPHEGSLLEHYSGHAWTAVSTPASQGALTAVTCAPSNGQCWAVGLSSTFKSVVTYHLSGTTWKSVAPAPPATSQVQVGGVACATTDDCLLVGIALQKVGSGQALAERWNGKTWSRIAVPGQLSGGGGLMGVACRPGNSPTTCWVVGQTGPKGTGLIAIHPLVERWNGSSLTLVTSPLGGAGNYPELQAVACAARTACQAVGSRGAGEDEADVLTEGWNGSSWSRETSPSPLRGFQMLSGVACPSTTDCWAVGNGSPVTGNGDRMLIEHYSKAS
jgi:hypothetical protein